MSKPWSTGLWGCCEDTHSCFLTMFCPCVAFGRIAEIVDRGSTSSVAAAFLYLACCHLTLHACLYSCLYRSKMRAQYGLAASPCPDCCVHWFCEPCALCQEYRELQLQGFDMRIGWQANTEKRGQAATYPPQVQAGMNR